MVGRTSISSQSVNLCEISEEFAHPRYSTKRGILEDASAPGGRHWKLTMSKCPTLRSWGIFFRNILDHMHLRFLPKLRHMTRYSQPRGGLRRLCMLNARVAKLKACC